jgi:ABC-type branched-subunit amino acid transport system ATPase component
VAQPQQGRVQLDGQDISHLRLEHRVRLGISRTFQTPRLDLAASVADAVMLGFYPRLRQGMLDACLPFSKARRTEDDLSARARALIAEFQLTADPDSPAGALSLGHLRLLEVARALASEPRYLLLDEPAAGIDDVDRDLLAQAIQKAAARGVWRAAGRAQRRLRRRPEPSHGRARQRRGRRRGQACRRRRRSARRRPPTWECNVSPHEEGALAARALSASYGSLVVCRDITLDVKPGEVVALIGPNGAGKTSFIGALAGAVASKGEVALGATRLDGRPIHARTRLGLATVPDNRGLFAPLTVAENIRLGAMFVPRERRAAVVERAMATFPSSRSAARRSPVRSRAASSRCSRSPNASPAIRARCSSTSRRKASRRSSSTRSSR